MTAVDSTTTAHEAVELTPDDLLYAEHIVRSVALELNVDEFATTTALIALGLIEASA